MPVHDLSVIPLFLLMGQFATQVGLSRALFQRGAAFIGHIRGGPGVIAALGDIVVTALYVRLRVDTAPLPKFRSSLWLSADSLDRPQTG